MFSVRTALLTSALCIGLAMPGHAADTREQLIAHETKAWEAWKTGDKKAYAELTGEPAIKVSGAGIVSGKENFVSVEIPEDCVERDFALHGFDLHKITDSIYALTYAADLTQTCAGAPNDHAFYSVSVWAKNGDNWKNVLLAEAEVSSPPEEPATNERATGKSQQ